MDSCIVLKLNQFMITLGWQSEITRDFLEATFGKDEVVDRI